MPVVDFEKMSDEILAIDEVMRYVGFTDLKGSIVYNKMKEGKTSLKNQEQERKFSTDLSTIKKMQGIFDESLGKVTLIHMIREKIHQLIYYVNGLMVYVTCERNVDDLHLLQIEKNIKSIIQKHIP